jgi:hypothetical protein
MFNTRQTLKLYNATKGFPFQSLIFFCKDLYCAKKTDDYNEKLQDT